MNNTNKKPQKSNQKPLTLQPLTFAQAIKKAVNTKIETKTIKTEKTKRQKG